MICHSFNEMNPVQKKEFLAKLCHIVQSSEVFFYAATNMINSSHGQQLLDGVKIIPNGEEEKSNSGTGSDSF